MHINPDHFLQTDTGRVVTPERNRGRPPDEIVDEQAIRNVFAAMEPPGLDEGFAQVIEVA
ncbi:hypothetical protein EIP75_18210 [Aquabacterium soli]|uniref:Uncharacterized protein n=1 Tax=Aquabacterium soli TaxID=2493092 RepID=A0A3R8T351_9BURK|nr:hypothetical protein [Aquabacterium soli]RRS02893.1 hypothetical protein EIP75_18210 [Aquabacterium soli]